MFWGADVTMLREAARRCADRARDLGESAEALIGTVEATPWSGSDAAHFRQRVHGVIAGQMGDAVEQLARHARTLELEADDQDEASAADGAPGDAFSAPGTDTGSAPTGAEGLRQEITGFPAGDEDRLGPLVGAPFGADPGSVHRLGEGVGSVVRDGIEKIAGGAEGLRRGIIDLGRRSADIGENPVLRWRGEVGLAPGLPLPDGPCIPQPDLDGLAERAQQVQEEIEKILGLGSGGASGPGVFGPGRPVDPTIGLPHDPGLVRG